MKLSKIIVAPIGMIILPERENEEELLLKSLDWVGYHAYCGEGHVIFLRGVISKIDGLSNRLKCARCNMVLAYFPAGIETYGQMRRYFKQIIS